MIGWGHEDVQVVPTQAVLATLCPAPAASRIGAYLAGRDDVTALPTIPGSTAAAPRLGAGSCSPPAPGRGCTGPRSAPCCAASAVPDVGALPPPRRIVFGLMAGQRLG